MKKLSALLLTLAFLAALTLTAAGASPADPLEDITGTVTIKIAHNMDFVTIPDAIVEAANRLNEKFKAEGRDLTILTETDYQRIDWNEYMQNVLFATMNGEGPDIFSSSGSVPDNVRSNLLMDISAIDTSYFVDGVFDPYRVDGKIYAMPFDAPTRVVYYNKNVLKAIGWTDEQVKALPGRIASGEFTWENLIELCKETQDKGAAKWGMLHRPGAGADFVDVLRVYGGKNYTDDGKLLVNQAAITRYFQFVYDAANTLKITPQDLNQQGWPNINLMVGNGEAFAYYGPIFSATYPAQAAGLDNQQFADQMEFVLFPKSEFNAEPFTVAAPQSVSINASTRHPEVCMALLRELYEGNSLDLMAKHGNVIFSLSSVRKANDDPQIATNPILASIGYMTDYVVTIPPFEGDSIFRAELFKQIVLLELGQTTPEQAYADLRAQVEINVDSDQVIFQ